MPTTQGLWLPMFVFIIVNKNSHELTGGLVFIEPVQVGLRKVTPPFPPPFSPPGELLGCQIVRWPGGYIQVVLGDNVPNVAR